MPLVINNPEKFARVIEHNVATRNMSYMEAILDFCETNNLEPESVAPFIGDKIKRALAKEGRALHLLTKDTADLGLEDIV